MNSATNIKDAIAMKNKVGIFYQPGFVEKDPFFGASMAKLPRIFPDYAVVDSDFLAANTLAEHFDVLIFPYGGYYPRDAWENIAAFIKSGGDTVILGRGPFGSPCHREDGKWRVHDPLDLGDRWRWSFTSLFTDKLGLSFWEVPDKSCLSSGEFSIAIQPELRKLFKGRESYGCQRFLGTLNPLYAGRAKVIAKAPPGVSTAYDADAFVSLVEPGFSRDVNGRFLQAGFLPDGTWTEDDFRNFVGGLVDVLDHDDERLVCGLSLSRHAVRADSRLLCSCWPRRGAAPGAALELALKDKCGKLLFSRTVEARAEMVLPIAALPEGVHSVELTRNGETLISSRFSVLPARTKTPTVKVRRKNGYAAFEVDGETIPALIYAFNPYDRALDDLSEKFSAADIQIQHFLYPLAFGWTGDKQYDWSGFDRLAERVLKNAPRGLLYPRIFLHTPCWWDAANPGELKVYANGDNCITNYVVSDNPLHANSKYSALGFNRKTYGQSWESKKWKQDMAGVLSSFIKHVEKSGYCGNVLGYFIGCGTYGEWIPLTNDGNLSWEDLSEPSLRDFRSWLREYYGGDDKKRAARWSGVADYAPEDIKVPPTDYIEGYNAVHRFLEPETQRRLAAAIAPAEIANARPPNFVRRHISKHGVFRDVKQSWDSIEYYRYCKDSFVDTMSWFADAAKEASGGKSVVGMFAGYLMQEFLQDSDAGHQHFSFPKTLNRVPGLDVITSPYHYYNRYNTADADANMRAVTGSIKLSDKICVSENDQRTCVGDIGEFTWMSTGEADLAEAVEALKRNFILCLSHGAGLWWYDFGKGWYDHPALMQAIKKCHAIYREVLAAPNPAPLYTPLDTLNIIYSTEVYDYINACSKICRSNTTIQMQDHFNRTGFPWEVYFLEDMPRVPASKAYLFLNVYALEDKEREYIETNLKKDGNVLIWLYAPGLYRDGNPAPANMSELTGIKLDWSLEKRKLAVKLTDWTHPITRNLTADDELQFTSDYEGLPEISMAAPECFCVDPDAATLGVNPDSGRPAFVVKEFADWKSVYVGCPLIPHNVMRGVLTWAGLTPTLDTDDALYTNGDVIGIRAKDAGDRYVSVNGDFKIIDLYGGREFSSEGGAAVLPLERAETFIGRLCRS